MFGEATVRCLDCRIAFVEVVSAVVRFGKGITGKHEAENAKIDSAAGNKSRPG